MENDLVVSLGGVIPDMVGSIARGCGSVNFNALKNLLHKSLSLNDLRARGGPAAVTP